MKFNKHTFIDELKEEVLSNKFETRSEIERYIHEQIDNECIYTAHCYEICQDLHGSENFGDATSVSSLAYECLMELVYSELDIDELIHDEDKELEAALDEININMLKALSPGEQEELNSTFVLYRYAEDDIIVVVKEDEWEEVIQVLYNEEDNDIQFESLV